MIQLISDLVILEFVKKDENSNITTDEIIGILQCKKLRLVGIDMRSDSDDLTCIEHTWVWKIPTF